jgi:hypothetical protein
VAVPQADREAAAMHFRFEIEHAEHFVVRNKYASRSCGRGLNESQFLT